MTRTNFLAPEICAECGGECCKKLPGAAMPGDFKEPLLDSLRAAFASGKWAVDWWEGDLDGEETKERGWYYIRPAVVGVPQLFHGSWGGVCVFLQEDGCALKPDERPYACRMLEPKANGDCVSHGEDESGKHGAALAWKDLHSVILQAARECDR